MDPQSSTTVKALAPEQYGSIAGEPRAHRRDAAVVVLLGIGAAFAFSHFELSEAILAWTQPHERFQLDELPGVLLVVPAACAWFAWRRYREARNEITRRRELEARLFSALAENRRIAQQYAARWDSEQKNVARELHDELGQFINAIKLDAVSIRDQAGDRPTITNSAVAIIASANRVHTAVIGMIRRLRPVGLDDLGLVATLEHCVDCWRERSTATRFALSVSGDIDDLSDPLNLTVYRLAQEGLTNVARHASATRVDVEVKRTAAAASRPEELIVALQDDGVGADPGELNRGFGLVGMRERVEQMGGRLSIETAPGQGFRFVARLPLPSRQMQARPQ
jgi:glucose-6-phosphate-specific signal transduction histidine kinase